MRFGARRQARGRRQPSSHQISPHLTSSHHFFHPSTIESKNITSLLICIYLLFSPNQRQTFEHHEASFKFTSSGAAIYMFGNSCKWISYPVIKTIKNSHQTHLGINIQPDNPSKVQSKLSPSNFNNIITNIHQPIRIQPTIHNNRLNQITNTQYCQTLGISNSIVSPLPIRCRSHIRRTILHSKHSFIAIIQ